MGPTTIKIEFFVFDAFHTQIWFGSFVAHGKINLVSSAYAVMRLLLIHRLGGSKGKENRKCEQFELDTFLNWMILSSVSE